VKASKSATQRIAGVWFALKQRKGFLGGVDQRPVEREQLCTRATREYELWHWLARGPLLCQLTAQVAELDCLTARKLIETRLQCVQSCGIREDLGGLLKCLVLVDRYEYRRWPPIARHDHMVTAVCHIAEQLSQVAPKLAYWDGLGHDAECTQSRTPMMGGASAREILADLVVYSPTMAYVVARPSRQWELREARSTVAGPRSRTLATFTTLTPEVLEHARARSSQPLHARELRRVALRAGAPVANSAPDQAAGELLAKLADGQRPRPTLRRLLLDALEPGSAVVSDSARAAARWVTASQRERGETLRDLLLLADRLPPRRTPPHARFPRVRSTPA
jgi:hypothetical protein